MIIPPPLECSTPPILSVIVPVYNEDRTLDELLRRLSTGPYAYPRMELIIVNDGSTDRSPAILERWGARPGVTVLHHSHNRGKGAAVRTALAHARGSITVIQDADLEYDPADWPRLIEAIRLGAGEVVYGSRYLRPRHPLPWSPFRLGVALLNGFVWLLYGQRLTDEATCYKVMPTQLWRDLDLQAEGFELCAEVTAKVCHLGIRIVEVPITYSPRTAKEGKKITWRDAFPALWTLLKWRFLPFRRKTLKMLPRGLTIST